jgi:hypothetical protein
LDELKNEGMISLETELKNVAVTSLITIINYEQYQGNGTEDGTENRTENGTGTRSQRITRKKISSSGDEAEASIPTKKKRRLSGERLITFNQFWEAFNYKSGKAEAADAWLDIPELTTTVIEQIVKAAKVEAGNRPELRASGRTPKMAQGWLSGRRWEDEYQPSVNPTEYVPPVKPIDPRILAQLAKQKAEEQEEAKHQEAMSEEEVQEAKKKALDSLDALLLKFTPVDV